MTKRPELSTREKMARSMSEATLQDAIVKLARTTGWLAYHTYDSRRSARGFPDLVMVKGMRLAFVELKKQAGIVSLDQQQWLAALERVGSADTAHGIEVYVWRPMDWLDGTIERVLMAA